MHHRLPGLLPAALALLALLVPFLLPSVPPARAEGPYAPAVIVNDQLVTEHDVTQRIRLMELLGLRAADMRSLAIESLIDDRLRAQAAKQLGVTATERQVEEGIAEFARQRGLTGPQLVQRLGQAGVTRQALLDLVTNQVAFREAMRLRFLARATPTDSEVETERARGPGLGQLQLRLAELVLPVRERGEIATRRLADELYASLSAGGDFAAAARRYSRAPTGRRGGEVGWLPLDRLPPTIATELAALSAGGVTRPIEVPNAIVLLKVIETRSEGPAAAPDTTVTVGRLVVPVREDASETDLAAAQVEAEQVGRQLRSCADVESRAAGFGPGSGVQGPVPLRSLPDAEREAIGDLPAGRVTPPVRVRGGLAVLLVCARSGAPDPSGIEQIRNRIVNERMASYAAGYLQELRRDAVIEYRR